MAIPWEDSTLEIEAILDRQNDPIGLVVRSAGLSIWGLLSLGGSCFVAENTLANCEQAPKTFPPSYSVTRALVLCYVRACAPLDQILRR